jgi:hypothetical protein
MQTLTLKQQKLFYKTGLLLLILFSCSYRIPAQESKDADKSLSPYFLVISDNCL